MKDSRELNTIKNVAFYRLREKAENKSRCKTFNIFGDAKIKTVLIRRVKKRKG